MAGDKTADNFEEGAAEDLDSTTESATVAVRIHRSIPSTLYNKLTTSFQPMTEDM